VTKTRDGITHPQYWTDLAVLTAHRAFDGLIDRGGQPMILHSLRVGLAGKTYDEMTVGFLHDVIEDTHITLEMLRGTGYPEHVLSAVDAISRRKNEGETYREFIQRVKTSGALAVVVKINDINDNIGRVHELPDPKERLGLYDKWVIARNFLKGEAPLGSLSHDRPRSVPGMRRDVSGG